MSGDRSANSRHAAHWGPGWCEFDPGEGPHRVRCRVEDTGGVRRVVSLCVEPRPGTAVADRAITPADLRRLASHGMRELLAAYAAMWGPPAATSHAVRVTLPRRWTEDALTLIPTLAASAGTATPPVPLRRYLISLGVNERTVDRLLRRARQRWPELLDPPSRGPAPHDREEGDSE